MTITSVNYMGLKLKSPFIASSSGFTTKIDNLVALEKAGAGAIVLKSLFEEQIENHAQFLNDQSSAYTENLDYLHFYLKEHTLREYSNLIKQAKESCTIPIIASINCFTAGNWLDFAKEIELAGADALEVNIYSMPILKNKDSNTLEAEYLKIIKDICSAIKIPVAVKIADTFTTLPRFVESLNLCGAKGVVLFNKFYTPDIDIKTLTLKSAEPLTNTSNYGNSLRWIAIISPMVRGMQFSASNGVMKPEDAIKLILAGATSVQLCSVLYKNGAAIVEDFNKKLIEFMGEKGFNTIDSFCGKLNYSSILPPDTPEKYERFQFIKTFWTK